MQDAGQLRGPVAAPTSHPNGKAWTAWIIWYYGARVADRIQLQVTVREEYCVANFIAYSAGMMQGTLNPPNTAKMDKELGLWERIMSVGGQAYKKAQPVIDAAQKVWSFGKIIAGLIGQKMQPQVASEPRYISEHRAAIRKMRKAWAADGLTHIPPDTVFSPSQNYFPMEVTGLAYPSSCLNYLLFDAPTMCRGEGLRVGGREFGQLDDERKEEPVMLELAVPRKRLNAPQAVMAK